MNAATRYVETSKTNSPVHAYVADHGRGVSKSDIEQTTVAGRSITLSTDVDTDDQNLIADGIQATNPTEKECFANALRMWKHNSRLKYVEGFAVMSDLDAGGFEHAWCLLDGEHLVDPTTESFDCYHGVVIDDPEILRRYADEPHYEGVIGNRKNQREFLREQGYVG